MRPIVLGVSVLLACSPEPDPTATDGASTGEPETTTSITSTTGDETSTTDPSATTTSTTGETSATTGETSGTTEPEPSTTTDDSSTTMDDSVLCCVPPDAPTAAVQALTPAGAMDLHWGWFGYSTGECSFSWNLLLFMAPTELSMYRGDRMYLRVDPNDWPDDFIGTGPAKVEVSLGDQFAMTDEAELTITHLDELEGERVWCDPDAVPYTSDARLHYAITIQAEGWEVSGTVTAVYCAAFTALCP